MHSTILFQLECGADYGIQFRVLCPGKMRTQLMVEVRKIVPEGTVAFHPDSHPSNNEYVTYVFGQKDLDRP